MPFHAEADAGRQDIGRPEILLAMVPGIGMRCSDFQTKGLIAAVARQQWPVSIVTIDAGPDSYLDGSVEARMLDAMDAAKRAANGAALWLAGISLGCQGILRCIRVRPWLAKGVLLVTPYLATTGLIAEVVRAGGLRRWAATNPCTDTPDRAFLHWLGTTPPGALPAMLVGHATGDRFAATAALLADLVSPDRMISVPGAHDWTSWSRLWQLMLDRNPFGPFPAGRK